METLKREFYTRLRFWLYCGFAILVAFAFFITYRSSLDSSAKDTVYVILGGVISWLFAKIIDETIYERVKSRESLEKRKMVLWGMPACNEFILYCVAYKDKNSSKIGLENYFVKFQSALALKMLEAHLKSLNFSVTTRTTKEELNEDDKSKNIVFIGSWKAFEPTPDEEKDNSKNPKIIEEPSEKNFMFSQFPALKGEAHIKYDVRGFGQINHKGNEYNSDLIETDEKDWFKIVKTSNFEAEKNNKAPNYSYIYNFAGTHADGTYASVYFIDSKGGEKLNLAEESFGKKATVEIFGIGELKRQVLTEIKSFSSVYKIEDGILTQLLN